MPSPSSCAARRTTRRADGPTRSIAAATLLIALFASGAWAAAGPTDRIAAGVQLRQAATGAAPALRFGRLSVDDGLSQSTVSAMLQDRLGYLWIGTLDGLNRYDGYGVTTYRYDPFTPSGLAGNLITALAEDARGRIWVGTAFGLSRLDDPVAGSFTHFRSDPDAPASLPSNLVQRLLPSADGGLWVVTGRGRLSFIAPDTDRVTRLTHDPDDPATLPDDRVHRTYLGSHTPGIPLVEDARGRLWIGTRAGLTRRAPDGSLRRWPLAPSVDDLAAITGESAADDGAIPVTDLRIDASGNTLWIATWGRGIHRLDLTADAEDALGPQTALRHTPGTPYSLGDDRVHSLWIDDVGALWIGRVGGVDRADPAFGLVQRYAIDDRGTDAPRGWIDAIFGLTTAPLDYLPVVPRYRDPHGDVWMVHGDGMLQLDIAHQQLVAVDHHPSDPRSLGAGPIRCTLIDRQGALWIGTDTGGVSHLDLRARPFGHVRHLPGQDDGLSSSDVFPIAYASDGGVWVGSLEGLDRVDPQTGAIRRLRHDPTDPASSLSSDRVLSLLADGDTLWIGTVDGGLDRLDLGTGAIRRYPAQTDPPADDPGILRGATPYALARGRDGTLWIGMTGGGLHRLDAPDAATPRYVRYANDPDDPTSLISSTVWVVHEDAQARLWVGTPGGLHRFDRARDRFVRYPLRSAESKSTVNNGVWTIYEDDDGVLWLGTLSGGLQRFEPDTGRFMPHTTATSALPNNTVMTIVPDRDGYLWLGTNNGLARFDPRTEQFRVFDQDHGLQSLEFNHQSATRTPDGRLWFGGINGISVIDPRDVLKPSAAPTVRIRRLTQIANGTSYGRADLDRPIALAPDARDLRFDYVGLHYATPSRMRYAHRLDPHDSDWQPVGGARSAAYTNLPPGRYVFRVRAAHRDGPWSPDATVHFEIRPPWWRAPWALAGYGLLMVLGVFLVDRVQRRRLIRRERRRAADDR
ncbi:MAG: two-component regulator propeller domain-containing protein, partial [Acidobacteriota bacterium]